MAPTVTNLQDHTLKCTEDYSPDAIGRPVVRDNEDTSPAVTFVDLPQIGCKLVRTWTARDAAGNTATTQQVLYSCVTTQLLESWNPGLGRILCL